MLNSILLIIMIIALSIISVLMCVLLYMKNSLHNIMTNYIEFSKKANADLEKCLAKHVEKLENNKGVN